MERFGDVGDPMEGSNVSLICRTMHNPDNPCRKTNLKWFYTNDSKDIEVEVENPPKGV